jgi:uncharacterized protein
VRNHENRHDASGPVPVVPELTYDPAAAGGCTVLELGPSHDVLANEGRGGLG